MTERRSNPHDGFFRKVIARTDNAASELRAVLPGPIIARIGWSGLELQPGSFVHPDLSNRFSNLLFRTRIDGHPAYIYILMEHQSSSEGARPTLNGLTRCGARCVRACGYWERAAVVAPTEVEILTRGDRGPDPVGYLEPASVEDCQDRIRFT